VLFLIKIFATFHIYFLKKASYFMSLRILNLDDPSTYVGIFDEILYADNVWPLLKEDFNGQQEIFSKNPKDITNPKIKNLRYKCDEVFKKSYICVMAYHACRTNNPEQYRRLGLLTATQERLEAKAREIFAGTEGLEEAISKAKSYFDAYEGSVHMYVSAKFAAIDYLNKGSLYLRKVAVELDAGECLERQGEPVFVKCKLPLSRLHFSSSFWGKSNFLYLYVGALIRRCIWAKAYPDEEYQGFSDAFAVSQAVPPENVEIIKADACDNWKRHLNNVN
jgi:hypothetical protein